MNTNRSVLFLCRHAPYGSNHAHESLDMAMAFAVFDQPVSLLFLGAGCLQLRAHDGSDDRSVKQLAPALSALPLYDIDNVYCDAAALEHYALQQDSLCVAAQPLDDAAIRALIADHDLVLCV